MTGTQKIHPINAKFVLMLWWCGSSRLYGPQHTVCITTHMTANTQMHANRQGSSSSQAAALCTEADQ